MRTRVFSPKTPYAKKATIVYRAFDEEETGVIAPSEMRGIFRQILGDTLPEEQLVRVVQEIMAKVDDGDGSMSQTKFQEALIGADLEAQMTVEVSV